MSHSTKCPLDELVFSRNVIKTKGPLDEISWIPECGIKTSRLLSFQSHKMRYLLFVPMEVLKKKMFKLNQTQEKEKKNVFPSDVERLLMKHVFGNNVDIYLF